jgi:hypothetical protein
VLAITHKLRHRAESDEQVWQDATIRSGSGESRIEAGALRRCRSQTELGTEEKQSLAGL